MKFIRRNGRIIPIREKGEKSSSPKVNENVAKAAYFGAGLAAISAYASSGKLGNTIGFGATALGLYHLGNHSSGKKNLKKGKQLLEHSKKYTPYYFSGLFAPSVIGLGILAKRRVPNAVKHFIIKRRIPLKNAANKVGDAIMSVHDKLLVKRVKTVDLSKGAKTFKGKYNKLSGLLGHNK